MTLVINNPVVDLKEIDRAMSDLINNSHRDDFREINFWMIKTGLGENSARKKLINEASRCISKEISYGLVQVTIEELEGETEITAEFEKKLPAIYPHIDFVIKSGAFDVWTTTYWFRVTSNVKLNNLAIKLKKGEITGIKSGNMQTFVTLAYCCHERDNPLPFILFKDKKVIDLELAKVVRFE
jgi:hypothetical protein